MHPSGERYEWENEAVKPAKIDARTLSRRMDLAAAGAALAALWPERGRHNLVLPLAGTMATSGYALEEITELVLAICQVVGDEQAKDRLRAVEDTLRNFRAGRPISGLPTLVPLIGEGAIALLKAWLGLGAGPEIHVGAAGSASSSWTPSGSPGELETACGFFDDRAHRNGFGLIGSRAGKLSLLAGDPGLSKAVLSCAIAAIVTGRGMSARWHALRGGRRVCSTSRTTSSKRSPAPGRCWRDMSARGDRPGGEMPDGKQRLVTLADVEVLERSRQASAAVLAWSVTRSGRW